MLRNSLRSARVVGGQPVAAAVRRQWVASTSRQLGVGARYYANQNKPPHPTEDDVGESSVTGRKINPLSGGKPKPEATEDDFGETLAHTGKIHPLSGGKPKPPATEDDFGETGTQAHKIHPLAGGKPKPPATEDDIGETSMHTSKINPLSGGKPKPPATEDDVGESSMNGAAPKPPPPGSTVQTEAPTPPPPPPPRKKGFFRRLRNFFLTLILLGGAGFAGGVWYSRMNDSFHDIFCEFVPFGEQAVLYLEEMEMRKRFPHAGVRDGRQREGGQQVRIPAQSGASWRVADSAEPTRRQSSSGPAAKKPSEKEPPKPKDGPSAAGGTPAAKPSGTSTDATGAKDADRVAPKATASAASDKATLAAKSTNSSFKSPEVNEPSKFPPLEPIDLMSLADAKEPVVRDLVRMLNDLILVINADGAHGKYSTSIDKAKNEIKRVGGRLKDMRSTVERKAAGEVKTRVEEFDKAATDLVERVEKAMVSQEMQWRQEFESEMKSVRDNYDERVKVLMEREKKLNEEKLRNQLLEQAVALKKEFVKEVKDRVENERESRLGKLNDLTSAVSDLEKLTVGWNEVVDANLKTQQLHVAVEAVRANLEEAQHPRPFIRELVALKEIASDDPIVNAAIASVSPSAYQRGVPSSSQLIDRFRKVANEVRKASLLPEDAGVASHASSWVLSHVLLKKQGLAAGSDVESILTRAQTFLEEGDLDAAAREVNGLQGWAKTLSKDWLGEVRKVLEVQQALDVIATEARLQSLRVD